MVITLKVAVGMIVLAWLTPTAISFLPIFLGWYTTSEFLEEKTHHPEECLFVVNKTYAFLSSSLTFWLPVLVMISLYYRIYKEAKRHMVAIRRHSVPMICHSSLAVPSSSTLTAPSSYSLNIITDLSRSVPQLTSRRPSAVSSPGISLESPGSPQRQSSPCLKPPGPRPPGMPLRSSPVQSMQGVSELQGAPALESLKLPCQKTQEELGGQHQHQHQEQVKGEAKDAMERLLPPRPSSSNSSERRAVRSANWRKEHKAFVTLGLVMGAFLLCWFPFFLWYLISTICGPSCPPSPDVVVDILFWIGYFNSTLNPLIYVMTNHDFKEAFTSILRKALCCNKEKGERADDRFVRDVSSCRDMVGTTIFK